MEQKMSKGKIIHREFMEKLNKEKIPVSAVGVIMKRDGVPRFLEVVVRRPERYSQKGIMKLIPKKYKGVKVKKF